MKGNKVFIGLTVILILILCYQFLTTKVRDKRQLAVLNGLSEILIDHDLNTKGATKELTDLIESLDTLVHRVISHSKSSGKYALYDDEITNYNLFILGYTPASKFKQRLLTLYESEPGKYRFLDDQFDFAAKYWFRDHFMNKSLVEVLTELALLRQRLILFEMKSQE